jgi:GTP cyclohydrolase II
VSDAAVLLRVQDQCVTSEIFGSLKCDCKQQLDFALAELHARAARLWTAAYGKGQQAGAGTASPTAGSMPSTRSATSVASLAPSNASEADSDSDGGTGAPRSAASMCGHAAALALALAPPAPPALPVGDEYIAGVVVYLLQEGRGIGLAAKIAAYALQEDGDDGFEAGPAARDGSNSDRSDAAGPGLASTPKRQGLDTVDANRALGLPDDVRQYGAVADILRDLGLACAPPVAPIAALSPHGRPEIALLTNNPRKLAILRELGIPIAKRVSCHVAPASALAARYLQAKVERMGHDIPPHVYSHVLASLAVAGMP